MKNQLLCLLGLFFLIFPLFGQPEKQWLIWNGYGKSGYSGNVNNYSTTPTQNSLNFTLTGVNPANRLSSPDARNDLFIIYADGQHFNTRSSADPGFFYNSGDVGYVDGKIKILETDHYFQKSVPGGIRYLYLTNIYEGDDPPEGVRAPAGLQGSPAPSPAYPLTNTSTTDMLTANHEVVFGKDITVIINYDLARNFQTDKNPQESTYSLKFDRVETVSPSSFSNGNDYVDLQPVFETSLSAILPIPSIAPATGNEITLEPGTASYGYVNFRPIPMAPYYYPPNTDGSPRYRAVFVLKKDNQEIDQLAEGLRFSHDPNFLQVLAIYKQSDNSHIVKYHLEFENTSIIQAEKLSTEVYFPPMFDLSDIDDIKWRAAGFKCKGKMYPSTTSANSYIFEFKDHNPILMCTSAEPERGTGYVEFTVKVRPGFDLSDVNTSLKMDSINVFFDGTRFPLHEFRDLVTCNSEVRPVDGIAICQRPLSKEPEPFCWWWILIIVLILVIAFWVWVRNRNNSPTT